jgi:outer membrane usher protein
VGAARSAFGSESFGYGDALLVGRHRYGFSDRLTAGFRVELGPELQQGGVSAAVGTGAGELELAAAASADRGEPGGAGFVAWRYASRRLSGGVDLALLGPRYATSTLRAEVDRARWRAGASLAVALRRSTTLQLQYSGEERRDAPGLAQRLEARTALRLASRAWLTLAGAVFKDAAGAPGSSLLAQLVIAAPDGTTVDAAARAARAGAGATTGAQRGLPAGEGFGYRVRADSEGAGSFTALVQANRPSGRIEAGYDHVGEHGVGSLSAAGALVLVGSRLFATRPAEQSFALVRVPGVPGVRTYLDRRPVGRTDARGDLLVSGLLPYYGNRIAIEDTDVPATHRLGRTERLVSAPPRGGAVVEFEVAELRAVEGRVTLVRGGDAVRPAYGTLEVDVEGGTRRSPLSAEGAFWVDEVPAGRHAARVIWAGETCALEVEAPIAKGGVLDLGELTCTTAASAPGIGPGAPPP